MLSGPSFRLAFVSFFINSLILSDFPLTSFHLTEASLIYLLLRDFIVLCVQLSKDIKKCLLFVIIHIFSTHFAINLFYKFGWPSKIIFRVNLFSGMPILIFFAWINFRR